MLIPNTRKLLRQKDDICCTFFFKMCENLVLFLQIKCFCTHFVPTNLLFLLTTRSFQLLLHSQRAKCVGWGCAEKVARHGSPPQ